MNKVGFLWLDALISPLLKNIRYPSSGGGGGGEKYLHKITNL